MFESELRTADIAALNDAARVHVVCEEGRAATTRDRADDADSITGAGDGGGPVVIWHAWADPRRAGPCEYGSLLPQGNARANGNRLGGLLRAAEVSHFSKHTAITSDLQAVGYRRCIHERSCCSPTKRPTTQSPRTTVRRPQHRSKTGRCRSARYSSPVESTQLSPSPEIPTQVPRASHFIDNMPIGNTAAYRTP